MRAANRHWPRESREKRAIERKIHRRGAQCAHPMRRAFVAGGGVVGAQVTCAARCERHSARRRHGAPQSAHNNATETYRT